MAPSISGITAATEGDTMQRYSDSLSAMNIALNLMIEEGDTLLVAAIAHPLHLIETQLLQKPIDITVANSTISASERTTL